MVWDALAIKINKILINKLEMKEIRVETERVTKPSPHTTLLILL